MLSVEKAIDRATARAIERLARSFEPAIRDAFLAAIRSARSQATLDAIAEAMRDMNPGQAIRAATAGLEFDRMRDTLADLVEASGERATRSLRTEIGPIDGRNLASFDIVNPYAVSYVRHEVGNLIREIDFKTLRGVQNVIGHGISTGIAPRESAKQIKHMIGLTEFQTEVAFNYEAKLIIAGETNVAAKAQMYADKLLRQRALTIARTECLTGDSFIDGAMVRAVFRRWYDGPLVDIVIEDGSSLSTTPNHPMLGELGWHEAALLHDGDYLFCYDGEKGASASRDEDVNGRPSTISEIFDSTLAIGILERRNTRAPDFHGDGCEGQVDIHRINGELSFGAKTTLYEPTIKLLLPESDRSRFCFCDFCSRLLPINQSQCFCMGPQRRFAFIQYAKYRAFAARQFLSQLFNRRASAVFRNNLFNRQIFSAIMNSAATSKINATCFGQRSRDASFFDEILDRIDVGMHCSGDLVRRHSAAVKLKRVKSIRLRAFRGHVFNLSTDDGYFISNGFYTGNTIAAANGGQQAAWQAAMDQGFLDKEVEQRWITGGERVCEICKPMPRMPENQHVKVGAFFVTGDGQYVTKPPAHVQCLTPDIEVNGLGKERALRVPFRGWMNVIEAGPRRLTIGPNHPILTPRGFIPAHLLNEGDQVFCGDFGDGESVSIGPDKQDRPTEIQEIFKTLCESSLMRPVVMPTAPEYFHSDGASTYGEIEIVYADGLLRNQRKPVIYDLQQLFFERRNSSGIRFVGDSSPLLLFIRMCAALGCLVRGFDLSAALRRIHGTPFSSLGLGLRSRFDTVTNEARSKYGPANCKFLGEFIFTLSRLIASDDLLPVRGIGNLARIAIPPGDSGLTVSSEQSGIGDHRSEFIVPTHKFTGDNVETLSRNIALASIGKVKRLWYSGHVYDLQAFGGLYFANGIIASNCRCTVALNL